MVEAAIAGHAAAGYAALLDGVCAPTECAYMYAHVFSGTRCRHVWCMVIDVLVLFLTASTRTFEWCVGTCQTDVYATHAMHAYTQLPAMPQQGTRLRPTVYVCTYHWTTAAFLLAAYRHAYRHAERHAYRHAERHAYRHAYGHAERHVYRHAYGHAERHAYRHAYGHAERHVYRHAYGHAERHVYRHAH